MTYTHKNPEFYGIFEYTWNDGVLDCYQNVYLSDRNLSELPFKFGKVNGEFRCSHNLMSNLVGSPVEVNGNFHFEYNPLVSLEGIPKIINGNLFGKTFDELEFDPRYFPKIINGRFQLNIKLLNFSKIEDYPLCITKFFIFDTDLYLKVWKIIDENKEKFIPLLDNKIGFHQMIMRINPDLVQYYKKISPPTKKSIF